MAAQLFDRAIIVKLTPRNEVNGLPYRGIKSDFVPYIAFIYPKRDSHESESGASDCPDLFIPDFTRARVYSQDDEWPGNEEFMLTLTDESGKRTFAYCIRHLIRMKRDAKQERKVHDLPEVFAIISRTHAPQFYAAIARECVAHVQHSLKRLKSFCEIIYPHQIPINGASLHVIERTDQGVEKKISIQCQEALLARSRCSLVVRRISAEITVAIICSLLAEQRVLIAGDSVQSVCHAVQSIASLLQPFSWPYTLIPVLPDSLLEIVNSPTPYLIGVLRSNMHKLKSLFVCQNDEQRDDLMQDDLVIVDLDGGIFVPQLNEVFIAAEIVDYKAKSALALCNKLGIPKKLVMNLISLFKEALLRGNDYIADDQLHKAMLIWFATLIGPYKACPFHRALLAESAGDSEPLKRCKKQLIALYKSKSLRCFIERFVETGIFREWIRQKVNIPSGSSIENLRIYGDVTNQLFDELVLTTAPKVSHTRFNNIFSKAQNAIFRKHILRKI